MSDPHTAGGPGDGKPAKPAEKEHGLLGAIHTTVQQKIELDVSTNIKLENAVIHGLKTLYHNVTDFITGHHESGPTVQDHRPPPTKQK